MILLAQISVEEGDFEKRGSKRRRLSLALPVTTAQEGEVALVHDLSANGMRIETDLDMAIGERFSVDLPESELVEAIVVRREGRNYGCEFAIPVSPATVSATMLRAPAARQDERGAVTVEEIDLGADVTLDQLEQWHADFESGSESAGRKLLGFRKDHDGRIIAMTVRMN